MQIAMPTRWLGHQFVAASVVMLTATASFAKSGEATGADPSAERAETTTRESAETSVASNAAGKRRLRQAAWGTLGVRQSNCHSEPGWFPCGDEFSRTAVPVGFSAMTVVSSLGVDVSGDAIGGRGRYLETALGGGVGLLGGGLAGAWLQNSMGRNVQADLLHASLFVVPMFSGVVSGSIAGYEISANLAKSRTADDRRARVGNLSPRVRVSPDGDSASVGLAGRF